MWEINMFDEYSDLKNVGLKVNEDNIAEFWFDFFWYEDVTDDFFGNFTRRREVDVPFKVTAFIFALVHIPLILSYDCQKAIQFLLHLIQTSLFNTDRAPPRQRAPRCLHRTNPQ